MMIRSAKPQPELQIFFQTFYRVGLTGYTIINRVYRVGFEFPIINRVVFGSRVTTRLTIRSGSCQTRLSDMVGRVDTNPTREPELPSLTAFEQTPP
jgi:hypothetical protein